MSTRIHRAIGWGLDWETFLRLAQFAVPEDQIDDEMEGRFTEAGDVGLTVPEDYVQALFDGSPPLPVPILERRLLSLGLTAVSPHAPGPAHQLYATVNEGDTPLGILFFPDLTWRARWHRRDDDIDYAFERWRTDEPDLGARSVLTPTALGHHPWTHDLMDTAGNAVPWSRHGEPDAIPAVPHQIRWYLTKLGILDAEGVLALRPMIAQWWS